MFCIPPRLVLVLLTLSVGGCDGASEAESLPRANRTRGSAVVLTRDERIAVAVNRAAGVVSVLRLDRDAPPDELVASITELDMGAGSEPWAAAIGGDDDSAYVVSRSEQTVTRIVDLRGEPRPDGVVSVGSEPTAIAIAPSGDRLFVANWGDGTISVVTTPDFGESSAVRGEWDLNEALAATGVLGEVAPHRGLSHPRALALTDDGDDDDADETLYVTEFFSMPLPGGAADEPGHFDLGRQGFVYPIPLGASKVEEPISIAPVDDTGFEDSNGATTGCQPNQLQAAAVDGDQLLVIATCASPEGPLGPVEGDPANFKTVVHPALFVIDLARARELPERRVLLNAELEALATSDGDPTPRMALTPSDLALIAPLAEAGTDRRAVCLTAMGTDAVFCLRRGERGELIEIGEPGARHVDLREGRHRAVRAPIGIAASQRRPLALALGDVSQNLAVIDLETSAVQQVVPTAADTPRAAELLDSPANAGRGHFVTGASVWSFRGQGWLSCESCHPDGLSDGVTWFFARGPRRTLSTAPTYYGEGIRRVLLWTGNVDEVHDVEGIVRSVAGGVGAITWQYAPTNPTNASRLVYDGGAAPPGKPTSALHHNLNASVKELLDPPEPDQFCNAASEKCDRSPVHDWDEIDAYVASVRGPRRPAGLDSQQVERGADVYRAGRCADCHGGPGWTLSRVFYTPGMAENGALPFSRPVEVTDAHLGRLRLSTYEVPELLRPLNPPGASGSATLRRWDPPPDRDRVVHLYGKQDADGYDSARTHGGDQINCVLRDVGTFPAQPDPADGIEASGIVPETSPVTVRELRQDMTTLALGATGFNIPSLLGVASSAPYFHAGNARTLEEVFDPAFERHHQALSAGFLAQGDASRADQLEDLIAFLLSIDDDKPDEDPAPGVDLCPDR